MNKQFTFHVEGEGGDAQRIVFFTGGLTAEYPIGGVTLPQDHEARYKVLYARLAAAGAVDSAVPVYGSI